MTDKERDALRKRCHTLGRQTDPLAGVHELAKIVDRLLDRGPVS